VPDARLVIGPSIGDQGIDHFSYYSYAPEGIAAVNGEALHINAAEVHADRMNSGLFNAIFEKIGLKAVPLKPVDHEVVPGTVQWAGVGDTYFGMIAVPPKPVQGMEYRTVPYEHKINDKPEQRFLISGFLPLPVDGTPVQLYTGPKDHRLLRAASDD